MPAFPPQAREPELCPRILKDSDVLVDKALAPPSVGAELYVFEHEADAEMVIVCAAMRSAAETCLDKYYAHKGGSEAYDLDDALKVTVMA